jgi:hypothetical protein
MTRTIIALFDDIRQAEKAVQELVQAGFSSEDVSILANDVKNESLAADEPVEDESAADGAGIGAGIGAVVGGLGGLLVGLGALALPGIGPVIAAGPLAAALTGLAGAGAGAVAGGVAGGLLGALVEMGVPEENAHYYAEGVRRGSTLVILRAPDDRTNQAVEILNRYEPVDINDRILVWRSEGWSGFDPAAGPYQIQETPEFDDRDGEMEVRSWRDTETQAAGSSLAGLPAFSDFDTDFRHYFESQLSIPGTSYEQYLPAYRYGYDLATHERFQDQNDWISLESDARRFWEQRNPGTWDRYKDAVRHAWQKVKNTD